MEQNKIITIVVVSTLIGGMLGGGISYYLLNNKFNDISNSLIMLEHSIDESLIAIEANIADEASSIDSVLDEMDSATSDLVVDVANIKSKVEEIYYEPYYRLRAFATGNQSVVSIDDYPETLYTVNFAIKGDLIKINYHIKIWDIDWGHVVYGNILVYDETRSHVLIASYPLEAQKSSETFIGEILLLLKPGIYSIEVRAGIPEFTDFKIEDYDILIWDFARRS